MSRLTLLREVGRPRPARVRRGASDKISQRMLCAAIDIGSNTTQGPRRRTGGGPAPQGDGAAGLHADRQGRDAGRRRDLRGEAARGRRRRLHAGPARPGARRRGDPDRRHRRDPQGRQRHAVAAEIERAAGVPVDVLSDHEEGRLAFIGATKALGHPVEGEIAVVDVGGGSSEVSVGTIADGVREVHSFGIGSGVLSEDLITGDPPGPGRDPQAPRADRGLLRRRRARASRPGRRRRRQRDVAAPARRRRARVRDARARRPRADQRSGGRGREEVRARSAPGRGPRRRSAAARAVLADARPAASDRQGRAPRGRDPRDADRRRRRRPPPTPPSRPGGRSAH